jgi:hypothetical protein
MRTLWKQKWIWQLEFYQCGQIFTNKPGYFERVRDEHGRCKAFSELAAANSTALAKYSKIIPVKYTTVQRAKKYNERI